MALTQNLEINENFELAFRFVTETNENIFLTGKAGTGKTTFLKYLVENCTKNIVVAAPTGVAAINANGVTLHSLFQLPLHPFIPTAANKNELLQKLRFTGRRMDILRKMDLLVIDEISMVRCDTIDAIDTILRHVRRVHDIPFGGVQILFIGDLYQLPPVATRQDWMILQEYYNSEFFFDSYAIKDEMPALIELKKIFRQKNDLFISILNKVRNNDMQPEDFEALHRRYQPEFIPPSNDKFITLTSHNITADKINNMQLARLSGGKFIYKAEIEGDFSENMYPAEESLELKQGAQVMFLKNDTEKRYFNGKIGTVKSLDTEEIIVECDGNIINVSKESWENSRYTLNRKDGRLEQELLGSFTQFPLRLAWAITIHKSQGLTFDNVMIDAGTAFSSGQVYVALSRCRSLDGIILLSKISQGVILCNNSVVRYQQSMTPRGSLAERFEGARQVYSRQLFEEIFSFNNIQRTLNILESKITDQQEKLNKEALKWIYEFKTNFLNELNIGIRFTSYIDTLMQKEPTVEKNTELQKRITDASGYFRPKFIHFKDLLTNHPIITEHREVAREIDDNLNQIFLLLSFQIHLFEYCKQSFSVTDFLKHKLKFGLPKSSITSYAGKKTHKVTNVLNQELFDTLKQWRDIICQDYDLPIYMVANQKSLTEIAKYLPLTKKDLMKLTGFGKAKAEKYGNEILEIVKSYCDKNGLKSNIDTHDESPKREKKNLLSEEKKRTVRIPTSTISYNLFKDGKSIEEIAKERSMAVSTIEGHLAQSISGGLIDINNLVPREIQKLIIDAASVYGWESFKLLKENLPDHITYGQLRMTQASVNIQQE